MIDLGTQELDTFVRERRALRTGGAGKIFTRVCTDSRALKEGDLFVALKGERFDGHAFVAKAREVGAHGAVVQRDWAQEQDRAALGAGGFALWMVDDTLLALGDIARGHLRRLGALRAALTGSNGKTTTKEFCAAILRAQFGADRVLATTGNLNNQVGVPMTAFEVTPAHKVALFEMGMNHPGEIAALCRIVDPQASLVTNVGPAHIGNFGGRIEGIAQAKGEVFAGTAAGGTICVNLDEPLVCAQADQATGHTRITFGRSAEAQWHLVTEEQHEGGQQIVLRHQGQDLSFRLNALGPHNAMNACAAAALASAMGAQHPAVVAGLQQAEPVGGRGVHRVSTAGAVVVDDSYNANPASMVAAINLAKAQVKPGGRLLLVLGDMLELGDMEAPLHAQVGEHVAAVAPDRLYVAGLRSLATAEGALRAGMPPDRVVHKAALEGLLDGLLAEARTGDVVLVKGSRGAKMERAVVALCGGNAGEGH